MENLLNKFKQADIEVKMREEYNTDNYINGYEIREEDNGRVVVFVDYEISYDEDVPCDFSFIWFEIDHIPTEEEKKFLAEHGYNI